MPYRDMLSYYSPSQVATILQKSPSTVRRLTALYADFLSEDATPTPGRPRQYTVEDVAILKAASEGTDRRQDVETIRASLATITLPEPTAELVNVATALPQPTTAPQIDPTILESLADVVRESNASSDRLAAALEHMASALIVFGVLLLAIVLITVAVAVGWIG